MLSQEIQIKSDQPFWKRLRGHLMYTFGREAKAHNLNDFLIVESAQLWLGNPEDRESIQQRAMDVICEDNTYFDKRSDELRQAIAHETLYFALTHS